MAGSGIWDDEHQNAGEEPSLVFWWLRWGLMVLAASYMAGPVLDWFWGFMKYVVPTFG